MKQIVVWNTLVIAGLTATTLGVGRAQAAKPRERTPAWCRQARLEIKAYEQALEEIRAEHEQGIKKLPAQHQPPARRNLYSWYWDKQKLVDRNTRLVDDKCTDPTRLEPDIPKIAPVTPTRPVRRPIVAPPRPSNPTPYNDQPRVYPPYRGYDPSRPQVPSDPFIR
jgi:hypothetical protein